MSSANYSKSVEKLRGMLVTCRVGDKVFQEIAGARDAVLARYQPIFQLDAIPKLTDEQFKSFLLFENNCHWGGLHRQGNRICSDMNRLRKVLMTLLDEKKPIEKRLDEITKESFGMGKAIITAVLMVAHPDRYGVWNNTSEEALKRLGIWPQFSRGMSFGEQYRELNELLNNLARDLQTDLWTMDSLFWRIVQPEEAQTATTSIAQPPNTPQLASENIQEQRFGLELHLHEFLRDNWDKTELGREWELYSDEGDPEAGYEFSTGVGYIDLLAKHKKEPRWLVIELKRGQSGDDTVGQVLRYMGWIRKHLAEINEKVEGLIIAHESDDKLQYAISEVPNVKLLLYEVSFRLRQP